MVEKLPKGLKRYGVILEVAETGAKEKESSRTKCLKTPFHRQDAKFAK